MESLKRKQSLLSNFFSNKKILVTPSSETEESISSTSTLQQLDDIHEYIDQFQSEVTDLSFDNDIGNFIGENIDDYTKVKLLENSWKPPTNFKYPFSVHKKPGKTKNDF